MTNLSEDQILELKDAFSLFDRSLGRGTIQPKTVVDVLRSVGLNPMMEDVEKMEKELGEKPVSFDSFLSLYVSFNKKPKVAMEEFIEGLRAFDKEMDGTMSAAMLRNLLVNLGDKLTPEEADTIIALEGDRGTIAYEKLVSKVMEN